MNSNRIKYREFCEKNSTIPIFSKDWWLDAVCGIDNWDVVIVEKNGRIAATLPFYKIKIKGIPHIKMPKLTQTLGPHIIYPDNQKYVSRLTYEKKIMTELIQRLPDFGYFDQNFHYSITNWLPFYWNGFTQFTRYTYVLEDLGDIQKIFSNFGSNIKTDIRKAEKAVRVEEEDDYETFYSLVVSTFNKQNNEVPYSIDLLKSINDACIKENCRKIFIARDNKKQMHAGVYIVWDKTSAYYLIGGRNTKIKNSGATSLLLWHAIQFAAKVTKKFDFEGSIVEPIERFFRAFGATQKPYFNISKVKSKKLRLKKGLGIIYKALNEK